MILDGRNGKPLLSKPVKMVVGTQSSPLVVSLDSPGNDIFLYWVSDCHGAENTSSLEFDFVKGTSVHDQSRADFCKLRFKDKLYTRLYALNSHIQQPGTVVYDSDVRKGIEYSNPINYTALGLEFLYRHPGYQDDYQIYQENENPEYENRLLQQDFPDLPNRYDDAQLERLLNSERNLRRKYPESSEYNLPEYQQGDQQQYPQQYYMQQSPNERYYPENYRNLQSDRYAVVNKPRPGKLNPNQWQKRFPVGDMGDLRGRGKRKETLESLQDMLKKAHQENMAASNRTKRHVGPHDGGGIQRVISTGTLAPRIEKSGSGIDVVYATFWFYPSETQGLFPEDKKCIQLQMSLEKQRFDPTSQLYGMDHDAYEELVTEECLKKSGHLRNQRPNKGYNPFNRPMGQMTVYRTHLDCACSKSTHSKSTCAKILPFEEQMWTSYMGLHGDSIAKQRQFKH